MAGRGTWSIEDAGGLVVIAAWGAEPPAGAEPLGAAGAAWRVESWFPLDQDGGGARADLLAMASAASAGLSPRTGGRQLRALVRRALLDGRLTAYRSTLQLSGAPVAAAGPPAPSLPPPGVEPDPREIDEPSTFYQLTVVDERGAPIAGLDVAFGQDTIRPTGPDGAARLDGARLGGMAARVVSLPQLATLTQGYEARPVRTDPLPEGEDVHVRVPSRLGGAILLAEATPARLVIVSRVDVAFLPGPGWEGVQIEAPGPWRLDACGEQRVLRLHASGLGQRLRLIGPDPPEAPAPPPLVPNPFWEPPAVYVVQLGDTLGWIAATYLGSEERAGEIWALNAAGALVGREPYEVRPMDRLVMPADGVPDWIAVAAEDPDPVGMVDPTPPELTHVDVDDLHEALFDEDYPRARALLAGLDDRPCVARPSPAQIRHDRCAYYLAALAYEVERRMGIPIGAGP
jgi:hypothetical protein